jgi:predicted phage tail protein
MLGRHSLGLVMLSAISIGCGSGNGIRQNVPAGHLIVTPSTLDFGKVEVGQETTQTGVLTAGNAGITVTSADWSGEGYVLSGIAFPLKVQAGQSVPFRVTFSPQKAAIASGSVSFLSDAANSPHKAEFSASATQTGQHKVTLEWRTDNLTASGYNIYRAVTPQGPYAKMNIEPHSKPIFTDVSVQSGQTYFYVATALSERGKESKFSRQIRVTIPNS